MSSLITEYPLWFIVFCLGLGFLYAFFLYRKDKKYSETPRIVVKIMFGLRFISVTFIAFLLLSPVLKLTGKTIEKPLVLYVSDQSGSMVSEKEKLTTIEHAISDYFEKNSKEYRYKKYSFGEDLLPYQGEVFNQAATNLHQALSKLNSGFYRRNLAAVILVSDGIYNTGNNPEYISKETPFPIYTLAVGDTALKPDQKLVRIVANKTAYLNNFYPVRVNIASVLLKNKTIRLKLFDNGKLIAQKERITKTDEEFAYFDFELKADQTGFHKITAEIVAIDEEINIKNNIKQVIVEVIDSKQKVLILADAPHPDISAFRQALELNQNYETDFFTIDRFTKSLSDYQLVVMHQLPSVNHPALDLISQIANADIPVIYILGNNSSLAKFDQLNTGLKIGSYSNKSDEVQGILNKDFDLFTINPDIEEVISNAPPLYSPFGEYQQSADAHILFFRKVKTIPTTQALMLFNTDASGHKTAVIAGEGIWRWRIFDYKINGNHYLFNELINKTVQFMTVKEMKEQFMVFADRVFSETTAIDFKAETYDKNFKPVENSIINLTIIDSENKEKRYEFQKDGYSYTLSTQKFSQGDYRWKAETLIEGKAFKKEGMFTVMAQDIESDNLVANHNILYKISRNTGGKLFYPNQIDALLKEIEANENIVPIAYTEKKTNRLINFKFIFILLTLLLSGEWFLRKYYGGY
jgi:hypothetical protein